MVDKKNDFLATYHSLKFSKTNKDDLEAVDIERRSIAMKYFAAKKLESKELAACLLHRGLQDYQVLLGNKQGVNNYWKQIKLQTSKTNNDAGKWSTGLKDITTGLHFIKSLSCQQDNRKPCKSNVNTDKCVATIINSWQNKDSMARNRKVSSQEKLQFVPSTISSSQVTEYKNSNDLDCFSLSKSIVNDRSISNMKKANDFNRNPMKTFPPMGHCSNLSSQLPYGNELQTQVKIPESAVARKRSEQPTIAKQNLHQGNVYKSGNNKNDDNSSAKLNPFKTAKEELNIQQAKNNKPTQKKTLGGKPGINAQFVCPLRRDEKSEEDQKTASELAEGEDEKLKNIEPKMIELIKNEIMDSKTTITWDDIAGLEYAKKTIKEVVVYPMLRPDIFTGLRRPPKGILLFGPPGTGKTLIGKCIAVQSKSTFFSISASSLTSKWIGEGEKMVRALFAVARVYQPSVIFVDEIDSLLTQRSETEHESSRRLKTEFLVQLDGAATAEDDRILIVGATNRPQELDEAARRRLVKRLYVPLPEFQARKQIISNLLKTVPHSLTDGNINEIAEQSKGYSGADMTNLCKEASMGPIRSIPFSQLEDIREEDVRRVEMQDFKNALIHVRPSVSESSLSAYVEWDSTYGSGTAQNYAL